MYGVEELVDILIEGDDNVDLYYLTEELPALKLASCSKIEQAEHRGDVEHIDHGAEDTEHEDLLGLGFAQLTVALVEFGLFSFLAVEYLNYLHARKVFREEDIYIRSSVLDLAVSAARELAEDEGEYDHEGNEAKHHEGEKIVEEEHCRKHANDNEHILYKVYQYVGKGYRDRVGIVGDSRNECSYGYLVELIVGKAFYVREEILANAGNYFLTNLLQNDGLDIGAYQGYNENNAVNGYSDVKVVQLKSTLSAHHFDNVTHNDRGDYLVSDREYHKEENENEPAGIGLGVFEQSANDLGVLHVSIKADSLFFVLHCSEGDYEYRCKNADDRSDDQNGIEFVHIILPPFRRLLRQRSPLRRQAFAGLRDF